MSEQHCGETRLLLVDDDELILETVGPALLRLGYAVTSAASGEEALAAAGRTSFDLAIVDIRMLKMSGIELAWRLREEHEVPAVFMSASADRELVRAAVAEGGLGYVLKPVDLARLDSSLQIALARGRELKELTARNTRLETELSGGRAVGIAVGVLMERWRLTQEQAFQLLQTHAKGGGDAVADHAERLVQALEALNRGNSSEAGPD